MSQDNQIIRRDFLFFTAAALLATSLPTVSGHEAELPQYVDWEDVLNRVIGHRNAIMRGAVKTHRRYEVGSPEWCMEEVLRHVSGSPSEAELDVLISDTSPTSPAGSMISSKAAPELQASKISTKHGPLAALLRTNHPHLTDEQVEELIDVS